MAEVKPLKSVRDIDKIKDYLKKKSNLRDYALFTLGINIGLRASDLVNLKVEDLYDERGHYKKELKVQEKKTKKIRSMKINETAGRALEEYYKQRRFKDDEEYVFQSRKTRLDKEDNESKNNITVRTLNKMVKRWCRECHIKGNYGSHTLRKTFAYHMYQNNSQNPNILPYLMKLLNHSSQDVTIRYIGLEEDELFEMYEDLNL